MGLFLGPKQREIKSGVVLFPYLGEVARREEVSDTSATMHFAPEWVISSATFSNHVCIFLKFYF